MLWTRWIKSFFVALNSGPLGPCGGVTTRLRTKHELNEMIEMQAKTVNFVIG